MNCDRTEQVSLLVDGELPRAEAASIEAHLAGCDDCRAARDEFLSLRRQFNSYGAHPDPAVQRRALETILSSKPAASRAEAAEADRGARLLAALGATLPRPAAAVSFALVVLATFVGLGVYVNSRRQVQTAHQGPGAQNGDGGARTTASPAPTAASPTPPGHTPDAPAAGRRRDGGSDFDHPAVGQGTTADAGSRRRRGGPRARHPRPRPLIPDESPAVASAAGASHDANVTAAAAPTERRELPRAGLDAARHVEQAQLLLRSFRNARATDDLAYERARSRRLLYRNIVLRREAAGKGDPVIATALGRLEPILLDIANLPDKPAGRDVGSIRERMRKKNLMVTLQAGINSSRQ